MRKIHLRNDKKRPEAAPANDPKRRRSFEWPLLIYPVLFLTTLAILFAVQRSIERESPLPLTRSPGAQEPAGVPDRVEPPDHPGKLVLEPLPQTRESIETSGLSGNHATATPDEGGTDQPSQAPAIAGGMRPPVDPNQLTGAAKTVAFLCLAVAENDHAGIKHWLDELVALGDEAVDPLKEVLAAEEGDTGLWAATALARIGTPGATGALLDRLAQTKDGAYREELGKRASYINNHESWPLLFEIMMETGDATVVRAAGAALSLMADVPILDEVIARYATASTALDIDRLAQFVRHIRSPGATESLLSLAGPVSSPPQDRLQEAAIEALARVGDALCVSHLLQRLEASGPGEMGPLFNTITRIDSPQAQASLLYAAAGNKEVSAEHGQTAAIYALKNYPNEQTVALLEQLLTPGQNEKVLTAATRTLDDIRRGSYTVAATTDALPRSGELLPHRP